VTEADAEKRSATGSEGAPVFLPRKGVLSREYHVLVIWPDGRRTRIGRFFQRAEAAQWIAQTSTEWLAQHFKMPSRNMLEQHSA
jgi:hypothetical protein